MAASSTYYPNFAAEMARNQIDYKVFYSEVGKKFGKSPDMVSKWIRGSAGELPTKVAFAIRDEYFPTLTVDYLFSNEPQVITD